MQTSALLSSGVGLLCTGKQLPNFLPSNEGSGFCKQLFTVLGGFLGPGGAEQITIMATVTWTALQTVEQLGCLWHSGTGCAIRSTQLAQLGCLTHAATSTGEKDALWETPALL